jgi:hypothetical protein
LSFGSRVGLIDIHPHFTYPQDWSDSDDEEWDGEWDGEWDAVEECEAPASTTSTNARTRAASTWAEPPFCPAVQTAPKAAFMAAAKYPLEFADLCTAPVSPLLH